MARCDVRFTLSCLSFDAAGVPQSLRIGMDSTAALCGCLFGFVGLAITGEDVPGRRLHCAPGAGAIVTVVLQNPATLGIATPGRAWYLNTHAWFHVIAAITFVLFLEACRAISHCRSGESGGECDPPYSLMGG